MLKFYVMAAIIIGLCAVMLVFAESQVGGQVVGPDESCALAADYHLREAGKWSQREDQTYHLGAAQAYKDLGSGCSGWEQDATHPGYTTVSVETPITTTQPYQGE